MKTFKYIAVAMLMTAVFGVTSVFADGENGTDCKRDGDCKSGHCSSRFPSDSPKCQECFKSSDCRSSDKPVCFVNQCVEKLPNGTDCERDVDCKSNHCSSNAPNIHSICQECFSDDDCPSGRPVCSENKCVVKLSNDTACKGDYDCKSGHCSKISPNSSPTCQECFANSDCPSDRPICFNNKCVGKLSNDKACKGDGDCQSNHCCNNVCKECCSANSDCPVGHPPICYENKCVDKLPNGPVCKEDYDCKSGHCSKISPNSPSSTCRECFVNSDCPSDRPTCFDNKCVDKLPNDRVCKGDYDCKSGHCCSGVCRECCYSNSDCPQGKKCNQFRCMTGS